MREEKTRLLIVDDDSEIRNILHEFLSRSYHCVALNSAEGALALLKTEPFDIIMSDITMARMTGLEMLPHIVRLAPKAVIIMISGQRTIEFAIEAMRAGAFDYITKPFELAEVAAVVRRAIEHRRRLENISVPGGQDEATEELRCAVNNQNLIVNYQPQVEIRSGRVVGAEALVRWQHPKLGLLLPAHFISLAEDTRLIVPIGKSVLRTACAQTKQWHNVGFSGFRIAVNVSPNQLQEADFVETVAQALDDAGITADSLEIEVTETLFVRNTGLAINTLTRLREMGISIAIDDFGTGYSSLGYLNRLPIDSVKLDSSFVKDATTDPDAAALVMAIITLAHNLNLRVVAEGIETEDQLAFLRLLRCDEGQGYFLGKPVTSDVITPLLVAGDKGGKSRPRCAGQLAITHKPLWAPESPRQIGSLA